MGRIRILPEILSNKIAAGEVVERPASVVKELLENAIDAESTKIFIDIEKGGRSLIRISDDGVGMKRDDALLAIERYATSKIYDDKDLFSIKTLGFRGEALPSIASVSKFVIETRDNDSDTGTRIVVRGGVIKDVEEISAAKGTVISVSTIFFNTPARRKFMKTINTEMGHIGDVVAQTALGWPQIQFRLTHNGRVIKNWSRTDSLMERVLDIAGRDLRNDLLKVSFNDDYFSFNGFISTPNIFRSTSRKIFIYVNGRFVKDRGIAHAVFDGFRGRLVKGRFPVAVLYININFDQVDVNVHPAKDEVRFSEHRRVYNSIRDAVSKTLSDAENINPEKKGIVEKKDEYREENSFGHFYSDRKSSFIKIQEEEDLWSCEKEDDQEENKGVEIVSEKDPSDLKEEEKREEYIEEKKREVFSFETEKKSNYESDEKFFFRNLIVCGQLANTYILCEFKNDLILIDQHAAHERIVFEDIKELIKENRGEVQRLLIPETIDLSFKEASELELFLPDLAKAGFEIEHFGDNTFVIKTVPSVLSECDSGKLISEIAEKAVIKDFSKKAEDLLDESLILMACHGAIRARQKLNVSEMEEILIRLDKCNNSFHCPHGRPTWVKYSEVDIKKAFSRIV